MVKMGTAAIRKAAKIACVNFRPIKKRLRFRVTPVIAAQKKVTKCCFWIFNFLVINAPKIIEAAAIRINAREKTGISVKVNFMIGAVAPQIIAAVAV